MVLSRQAFHQLSIKEKSEYLEVPYEKLNGDMEYILKRVNNGMHLRYIPDMYLTYEIRAAAFFKHADAEGGCWCCNDINGDEQFFHHLLTCVRTCEERELFKMHVVLNQSIQNNQKIRKIYENWLGIMTDCNSIFRKIH